MFRKFLERLRGSSRAPDDLAVGTSRPGDFVEPDADDSGESPVVPNPHEETEMKDGRPSD
jgi:hypothetical protein